MMPKMDGFQLCHTIKKSGEWSFLPVVLVTALGEKEDRIRGINTGCNDFFTKPFDSLELQPRVHSLSSLKRSHEDLEHAETVLETLSL